MAVDLDRVVARAAAHAARLLNTRSCTVRRDAGSGFETVRTVLFDAQDLEGRSAFDGAGHAIDAVYVCAITDRDARTIADGVPLDAGRRLLIEDTTAGRTFQVVTYAITDDGWTARLSCKRIG